MPLRLLLRRPNSSSSSKRHPGRGQLRRLCRKLLRHWHRNRLDPKSCPVLYAKRWIPWATSTYPAETAASQSTGTAMESMLPALQQNGYATCAPMTGTRLFPHHTNAFSVPSPRRSTNSWNRPKQLTRKNPNENVKRSAWSARWSTKRSSSIANVKKQQANQWDPENLSSVPQVTIGYMSSAPYGFPKSNSAVPKTLSPLRVLSRYRRKASRTDARYAKRKMALVSRVGLQRVMRGFMLDVPIRQDITWDSTSRR